MANEPKRKPGRPRKNPVEQETTKKTKDNSPDGWLPKDERERKEYVSRLINEAVDAYKMPKCSSDEELAQRLSDYFNLCAKRGSRPTVEEMSMYCGFTNDQAWSDYESGRRKLFSPVSTEILKKAKQFMKTFDAKLVIDGKMNPVVYFFRAKNYYNMRDNVEVLASVHVQLGPAPDPRRLASDYMKRLPDDIGSTTIDLPSDYVSDVEEATATIEEAERLSTMDSSTIDYGSDYD